jgi:hypothetical protein
VVLLFFWEMKDCPQKSLELGRPDVPPLVSINHALGQLFADRDRSIHDEVVKGLSYLELIGALLHARDLAESDEAEFEELG